MVGGDHDQGIFQIYLAERRLDRVVQCHRVGERALGIGAV